MLFYAIQINIISHKSFPDSIVTDVLHTVQMSVSALLLLDLHIVIN